MPKKEGELEGESSPAWGGLKQEDEGASAGINLKKTPGMLGNFTIYRVNKEFEDF